MLFFLNNLERLLLKIRDCVPQSSFMDRPLEANQIRDKLTGMSVKKITSQRNDWLAFHFY